MIAPRSPSVSMVMNRGGRQVHLRSPFGDDVTLEVNDDVTLAQLRYEVCSQVFAGESPEGLMFTQNGKRLTDEQGIQGDEPVEFTYRLSGGAGMQVIRTVPELARIHLACFKCGCTNMPHDLLNTDCLVDTCCCLHNELGCRDWTTQQILCCVVPLKPVSCYTVTKMPECLQLRILCAKCGCRHMPDPAREDWCTTDCCCLYFHCGPKDMCNPQILCLKCYA